MHKLRRNGVGPHFLGEAADDGAMRGVAHELDLVTFDRDHAAERETAVAREPTLDQRLMIDAGEEPAGHPAAVCDVQ